MKVLSTVYEALRVDVTEQAPLVVHLLPSQDLRELSRQICRAVSDLQQVNRSYGWCRLLVLFSLVVAGGWIYWSSDQWAVALGGLMLLGMAESGLLITTHEALHGTLLARPGWEGLMSCLISWPMCFPILTYELIHLRHHRWNSIESRDPERIGPCRMPWFKFAICAGGLGLIFKTLHHAWILRQCDSRLVRRLIYDATGILLLHAVILAVAVAQGCVWKYLLSWFVVERIVGVIMQSRALVEHWGLWHPRQNSLLSQLYGCRNVDVSGWLNVVMGGLPHHSAHHAFPAIPFHHLPLATKRIERLLRDNGLPPLPRCSGYLAALRQL